MLFGVLCLGLTLHLRQVCPEIGDLVGWQGAASERSSAFCASETKWLRSPATAQHLLLTLSSRQVARATAPERVERDLYTLRRYRHGLNTLPQLMHFHGQRLQGIYRPCRLKPAPTYALLRLSAQPVIRR